MLDITVYLKYILKLALSFRYQIVQLNFLINFNKFSGQLISREHARRSNARPRSTRIEGSSRNLRISHIAANAIVHIWGGRIPPMYVTIYDLGLDTALPPLSRRSIISSALCAPRCTVKALYRHEQTRRGVLENCRLDSIRVH